MDEIPATEFDSRTFDAKEVVQRYRKRVPLPQLQKSLQAHSAATRQELVELINEKYADFVSLSSRMQGVERALRPLRAPLEESSELTRGLRTKLGAIIDQAKETQKDLAAVRARKDALAAFIENSRILERAKESSEHRWANNPQESDDFLREYVAQENVARDLRRVRLNLGGKLQLASADAPTTSQPPAPARVAAVPPAGEGDGASAAALEEETGAEDTSPECQALLRETAEFEDVFAKRLQERLRSLLAAAKQGWEAPAAGAPPAAATAASPAPGQPGPPPRADLLAIAHLSRALVTVGRQAMVEVAFAEVFVKGALDAATAACSAAAEEARRRALAPGDAGGALGVGAGAVDLGSFFSVAQEALLADGAPLLWLARRLHAGDADAAEDAESAMLAVPSLCLVSNAIAKPVLQHVQQVWPNIFMPAFPDIFAVNHSHAMQFVAAVQGLMPASERQAFSQCFALSDFRRRWKTQVYFSLRQKEAVQRLQALAGKPGSAWLAAASPGPHGCKLEATAELMRILDTIWSDRWYLECLYPKMVQLSLELLSRYAKLICGLAETADAPGAGWDAGASPPAWAESSPPVRLARVASDVLKVVASLDCVSAPVADAGAAAGVGLARLLLQRLPVASAKSAAGTNTEDIVRKLLDESAAGLQPAREAIERALVAHVAAAAVPQFNAIRGIPALYRMLNKPVPTKPSPYVDAAMRPVLALRDAAHSLAPPDALASWLRGAADAAAAEFANHATQLLASTQQQEASLRRLGGRAGGAGGDAQASDLDKIHIQLCLDADAFTAAASALGAAAGEGSGLAKLAAAVAPVRPTLDAHRGASADAGAA